MTNSKIIFIGTSEFAVPALEKLIKNNYTLLAVVTALDKPVGRKQEITPPPVKKAALKYKLPILQPERISNIKSEISNLKPDLIIVAAYGQIIPKNILEIPKLGCLNLHPSLLPKYRGPSPIQTAIFNGEQETGITIMKMDEKIDHGPIIAQKKIILSDRENYQTLEKKLSQLAANFLIEILPQYLQNKIKPQKQEHGQATYTKILSRDDGKIDWNKSAPEIERMVRAFHPWPGTWTEFNGQRVKILKVKIVDQKLILELIQPAGKKPMTGQEFFRGHPDVKIRG